MKNNLSKNKIYDNNIIKSNKEKKKEEILKNEITCIYNKQEDEINLLYDYSENINDFLHEEFKKQYIEGKKKYK